MILDLGQAGALQSVLELPLPETIQFRLSLEAHAGGNPRKCSQVLRLRKDSLFACVSTKPVYVAAHKQAPIWNKKLRANFRNYWQTLKEGNGTAQYEERGQWVMEKPTLTIFSRLL